MKLTKFCYVLFLLSFVFNIYTTLAQEKEEKMKALDFMIGDWLGLSTRIDKGRVISSEPAFQKITYKVDKHIISIDLHSESLQLHTVIYYDEESQTYYYNPFYKNGSAKYKASYDDGKFEVKVSDKKRFIFKLTAESQLQEYGEIFQNGKWVRYFEDNFKSY